LTDDRVAVQFLIGRRDVGLISLAKAKFSVALILNGSVVHETTFGVDNLYEAIETLPTACR
jgi:hypothetical protein